MGLQAYAELALSRSSMAAGLAQSPSVSHRWYEPCRARERDFVALGHPRLSLGHSDAAKRKPRRFPVGVSTALSVQARYAGASGRVSIRLGRYDPRRFELSAWLHLRARQ